jgi:hypothetical protein
LGFGLDFEIRGGAVVDDSPMVKADEAVRDSGLLLLQGDDIA